MPRFSILAVAGKEPDIWHVINPGSGIPRIRIPGRTAKAALHESKTCQHGANMLAGGSKANPYRMG
jgi:hypothetical protein